jgi:hypothetical protein
MVITVTNNLLPGGDSENNNLGSLVPTNYDFSKGAIMFGQLVLQNFLSVDNDSLYLPPPHGLP